MLKFLLLTLTLTLITASAALLGIDRQPFDVLKIKGDIPISEEREEQKENEDTSKSSSSEEDSLKVPPRFIPDEPLDLDPSAQENREEGEDDKAEIKVPTEREIKKAANPYIVEIINIKENAFANLASMEKKIAIDYLSMPVDQRENAPAVLKEKYMPKVTFLLDTADKDVERALKKLEASLRAINAPLDIVDEAKKSYLDEKEEKLNYYRELLKSLGQDITLP